MAKKMMMPKKQMNPMMESPMMGSATPMMGPSRLQMAMAKAGFTGPPAKKPAPFPPKKKKKKKAKT